MALILPKYSNTSHKARKSSWNRAIIFLDDEASIDRGVLDALEATSISSITSHGSYETDNANIPNSQIGPDKEESCPSKTISNSILPVPLPYSRWAEGKTAGQKG